MAEQRELAKEATIMGRNFVRIYMTIGAIFGVILAGPLWFAALFNGHVPSDAAQIKTLVIALLIATFHGVVRAFVWLPSLVYSVGMHRMGFEHWLFGGWW